MNEINSDESELTREQLLPKNVNALNGNLNSKSSKYMCKILYTCIKFIPFDQRDKANERKRERKLVLLTWLPPLQNTYAAYINRCAGTCLLKTIFVLSSRTSPIFLHTNKFYSHFCLKESLAVVTVFEQVLN